MISSRRILISASMYHACNDGSVATLPALFPLLRDTFSLGYTQVGLISSIALIVTIIFQMVFGGISDRKHPRTLLAAGVMTLGIASLLTAGATTFTILLLLVIIARIGASFYHPIGIAWISREFKGERLDHAMGIQSAFGDIGVVIAVVSSGFLGVAIGWQVPFLLWGLLSISAAISSLFLTRDIDKDHQPVPLEKRPKTILEVIKEIKFWIIPLAIGGAAYGITLNFGPLFLTDRIGMAADLADLVIGLWIGVGIVTTYSFGYISKRAGRFNALTAAFLVIGISGLLLGFLEDTRIVLASIISFGAMLFITYPALFSFVSESTDVQLQGTTFGVAFAFQLGGAALVIYISGWLSDIFGIHIPFLVMALLGFLAFVVLLVGGRRHSRDALARLLEAPVIR